MYCVIISQLMILTQLYSKGRLRKSYYLISNTGYLLETAEIETAMHITKVARYFQSAVMPDVQKMMNLMVVYLCYQGMRILFDLRTRNMAVAGS